MFFLAYLFVLSLAIAVTQGGVSVHNPFYCYSQCTNEEIQKRIEKGKPFPPKKLFKLSDECPQIAASIAGVKELVTYFKQANLNAQLPFTLKQNVPTRWNSDVIMLESYQKSANDIKALMLKMDMLQKVIHINDASIDELVNFMQPFKECSEILSGDGYPTIQQVALWYHDLKDHIEITSRDSEEMQKLKQQAAHCFKEYLVVEDIYYTACIFDPR